MEICPVHNWEALPAYSENINWIVLVTWPWNVMVMYFENFLSSTEQGTIYLSPGEYISTIICNVHKCQLPLLIKMIPSYRLFQQPAPAPNNQIPAGHVHGASLTAACSLSWGGNAMMASIEAILNQPEIYIVIKFPTVENTPCTLT